MISYRVTTRVGTKPAVFYGYFDVPIQVPRNIERTANPAHALHLLVKQRVGDDTKVVVSKAESDYRREIAAQKTIGNTEVITDWNTAFRAIS